MTGKNNRIEKENIETTELSSQAQQTTSAKLATHTHTSKTVELKQKKRGTENIIQEQIHSMQKSKG